MSVYEKGKELADNMCAQDFFALAEYLKELNGESAHPEDCLHRVIAQLEFLRQVHWSKEIQMERSWDGLLHIFSKMDSDLQMVVDAFEKKAGSKQ